MLILNTIHRDYKINMAYWPTGHSAAQFEIKDKVTIRQNC